MLLQDELGSALAGEDVTLARMNMHSNEIPPEYKSEFFVKEYPSLFFKVDLRLSTMSTALSTVPAGGQGGAYGAVCGDSKL